MISAPSPDILVLTVLLLPLIVFFTIFCLSDLPFFSFPYLRPIFSIVIFMFILLLPILSIFYYIENNFLCKKTPPYLKKIRTNISWYHLASTLTIHTVSLTKSPCELPALITRSASQSTTHTNIFHNAFSSIAYLHYLHVFSMRGSGMYSYMQVSCASHRPAAFCFHLIPFCRKYIYYLFPSLPVPYMLKSYPIPANLSIGI